MGRSYTSRSNNCIIELQEKRSFYYIIYILNFINIVIHKILLMRFMHNIDVVSKAGYCINYGKLVVP